LAGSGCNETATARFSICAAAEFRQAELPHHEAAEPRLVSAASREKKSQGICPDSHRRRATAPKNLGFG
jgi:hypothetical protein